MAFDDLLVAEFRQLAAAVLAGRPVTDAHDVLAALAAGDCLDLELAAEYGGMELGLAPAAEVYVAMGTALAESEAVEAMSAALDLLTGELAVDAAVVDRVRSGAGPCELFRKSAHEWCLRGDFGEFVATAEGPWWSRRLVRQASYLTGLADAGYREALTHCRSRIVGGQPLLARQLVAARLVRLLGEIRLAWSACRDAVIWHDNGETDAEPAARAHQLAGRAAVTASRDLVQLLGARGLTDLSIGPRLYRLAHRERHRLTGAV
ncbi:acyl-CoA dehydrogenase family protein [Streptomyces sp. ID05-26A]|nr:acyl-CoA dehydrogenase family protein [Streptomyces sp. ID05-26A]